VLRGKAFSGSGAVVKVEVSLDDGKSWAEASLSKRKDHSWQEFDISVEVRDGKTYEALARATDAKGFTQPLTQSWNPKGYLYNAVDRIRFSVSEVEVRREQNLALVRQHCLTCHSAEIIGQQKLNKDSWRAVVKKMADYGLILDASTSEVIAMTLADGAFRQKPGDDRQQIFDLAAQPDLLTVPPQKEGLAKSGRVLFLSHCAACHGADALGETAPRLRGRVISRALFFSTVKHGRRQMPPFESRLNTKDMENILAWLATDVRQRRSD
jgi:mono/diheme cytochrome c family protein